MSKKKLIGYLFFFFCLAFTQGLTARDPEIVIPDAPAYLLEGSAVNFEVRDIDSQRLRWEFGDGSVEMGGRKISHAFNGRGTFNVRVSDLEGKYKDPVTLRVKIVRDDREIILTGQVFYPGVPVKIEARNFSDRSIRWDFGEGADQKLGRTVTHIYQRSGTYTIKATDWGCPSSKGWWILWPAIYQWKARRIGDRPLQCYCRPYLDRSGSQPFFLVPYPFQQGAIK